MILYHYCLIVPSENGVHYASGSIERSTPIFTQDDYGETKEAIAKQRGLGDADFVIQTLNRLS